jgi:hypothetical protein
MQGETMKDVIFLKDEHGIFAVFLYGTGVDEDGELYVNTYDEDGWSSADPEYCKECAEVENSNDYDYLVELLNKNGFIVNAVSKSLLERI